MARGFGIPATNDRAKAEAVAVACEELGYSSIWTNDGAADGVLTAGWMANATNSIRVGIGVVACDRASVPELIMKVSDEAAAERIVLGIGSGFSERPLETVRDAVAALRNGLGETPRLAVAAMGPRMCRLAGELADLVLLNWMTPDRIRWASKRIAKGGSKSNNVAEIASYIRVAVDEGARERIAGEANRYASIPHYGRHFEAMGVAPADVGVDGNDDEMAAGLSEYEQVLDEAVVRGVPETEEIDSTLRIVRAAAP
jgi:alkanesulfonate monooxygenase SsuD/methylene tetrahydromethanopterin reductase-like flavin-dependent oxidoreductase (luciferase family)